MGQAIMGWSAAPLLGFGLDRRPRCGEFLMGRAFLRAAAETAAENAWRIVAPLFWMLVGLGGGIRPVGSFGLVGRATPNPGEGFPAGPPPLAWAYPRPPAPSIRMPGAIRAEGLQCFGTAGARLDGPCSPGCPAGSWPEPPPGSSGRGLQAWDRWDVRFRRAAVTLPQCRPFPGGL